MLPPLVFDGVSPARFAALGDAARQQFGIVISGTVGDRTQNGFSLHWEYDASSQRLIIQCVSKPFLVPKSIVQSRITQLVESINE